MIGNRPPPAATWLFRLLVGASLAVLVSDAWHTRLAVEKIATHMDDIDKRLDRIEARLYR